MKKTLLLIATSLLCSHAANANRVEAASYSFNVSNATKTVLCNQVEIKILNNGLQQAAGSTKSPVIPDGTKQTVVLDADYCTKIQIKTVCSSTISNFHEKSCSGGNIVITSASEMMY